jgi:dolichol-phosphate mannosyltransferase
MPEMQPTSSAIVPVPTDSPEFSLVVPCYNEEDALPYFFAAAIPALETMTGGRWRIVCVDDGSRDRTFELIVQKHLLDPRVTGVRLSRNFGHQPALSAGLAYATGRYVGVIDCDLQDPIEALVAMYKKAIAEDLDVCYGVRTRRDAPWHLKLGYWAFYALIARVTAHPWPRDAGDFSVMSTRCQRLILSLPEHSRMLRGLRSWVGLKQAGFAFQRPARLHGFSKYNIRRLALLAAQGLIAFSSIPLRLASLVGLSMGGVSLLFGLVILVNRLFPRFTLFHYWVGTNSGTTTVVLFGTIVFSVLFLCVGIIGEYLVVILEEIKGRPAAVVDVVTGDLHLNPHAYGVLEAAPPKGPAA